MFYLLPHELNHEAKKALSFIRSGRYTVPTATELETERLTGLAKRIRKDELVDGHQYGMLSISYDATAIRGDKQISHSVEAYITLWTYEKESGSFYNENAWGGVTYTRLREGTLLFE